MLWGLRGPNHVTGSWCLEGNEMQPLPDGQRWDDAWDQNKQQIFSFLSSFALPSSHLWSPAGSQLIRDPWKHILWDQITIFTEHSGEVQEIDWRANSPGSAPLYLSLLESSMQIFQPFPALFNVFERFFLFL